MKATIRKLEQQLADRDRQVHKLTIENNSLKNLVRSLPDLPVTREARELVGRRRWEDLNESESSVEPSKEPLYLSSIEKVDRSNGLRRRVYEAKRSQVKAGLTNVFPIEVE